MVFSSSRILASRKTVLLHAPNLLSNSKDFAKSTSLIKNNKILIDLCNNIDKGIGTCWAKCNWQFCTWEQRRASHLRPLVKAVTFFTIKYRIILMCPLIHIIISIPLGVYIFLTTKFFYRSFSLLLLYSVSHRVIFNQKCIIQLSFGTHVSGKSLFWQYNHWAVVSVDLFHSNIQSTLSAYCPNTKSE